MSQNGDRGAKDRIWVVDGRHEVGVVIDPKDGTAYGTVHPQEVADLAADVATVVRMVGGTSSSIAERVRDAAGVWHTTGVMFKWSSYAPAIKLARAEEPPQVDMAAIEGAPYEPELDVESQPQLEEEPEAVAAGWPEGE